MAEANTPLSATAAAETEADWRQVVRHLAAIERHARSGPSNLDDEVGLRTMRITLGLAFAGEALRLAGALQDLRKAAAPRSGAP
ncbi:hypothetical protein [Methylobacterium oryzisoli]|uniref:hypothetical protein n=1 Tax=Methylobacterium oryzisoli TaxID=3385502 RepID=UPI003891D17A